MLTPPRLLVDEQKKARNAKQWWKHWWGYMPDGSSSETDIFVVFEVDAGRRFALHVEDKPAHGKLEMRQAIDYRRRAIHWAHNDKYLAYDDFETILMAPASFIGCNTACAAQFDRCLFYEDLASWIPLFAEPATARASSNPCG